MQREFPRNEFQICRLNFALGKCRQVEMKSGREITPTLHRRQVE